MDWSSHNVLAVGLGNCVYLWHACSSKVSYSSNKKNIFFLSEKCKLQTAVKFLHVLPRRISLIRYDWNNWLDTTCYCDCYIHKSVWYGLSLEGNANAQFQNFTLWFFSIMLLASCLQLYKEDKSAIMNLSIQYTTSNRLQNYATWGLMTVFVQLDGLIVVHILLLELALGKYR